MNTLTLASLYESQGHKREAFEIYWEICEKEPENKAAFRALERLIRERKTFINLNPSITKKFIKMSKKEHLRAFEKWLMAC